MPQMAVAEGPEGVPSLSAPVVLYALAWSRVGIGWRLAGCAREATPIRTSDLGPLGTR